ncbi:hypothetical protein [Marinicrinis lubricantis]|uniref:Uncharacterized protein n=1 Tax=Marinicrinis lubricantis TaxID=2086470 RepID=A0ABW1IT15_9BACL
MEFIAFNFFSILESIAFFMFVLVLFRFQLKYYIIQIISSAVILSQTSYYLRAQFDMDQVSYVSILLMFLLFWLLFKVQLFYSVLMAVTGFLYTAVLQSTQMLAFVSLGLMEYDQIQPFSSEAYLHQCLFFILTLAICALLSYKRIGFTFIPYNDHVPVKLKGLNLIIAGLLVITIIAVNMYTNFYSHGNEHLYNISFFILILILAGLLLLIVRREIHD